MRKAGTIHGTFVALQRAFRQQRRNGIVGGRLNASPVVGAIHDDQGDDVEQILIGFPGFDFKKSKFNRVTQAMRQPGSNFKPFIYSAALEQG